MDRPVPFTLLCQAEAVYDGRAYSRLERGTFLIVYKPDGSVAVHGARFKPLNYQRGGSEVIIYRSGVEFTDLWKSLFRSKPKFIISSTNFGESLWVAVYGVGGEMVDLSYNKIKLSRSEKELAGQMVSRLDLYLPNVQPSTVEIEAPTPYGNVDALIADVRGEVYIVEVKRKIVSVSACSQVARYAKWHRDECGKIVHELLAAPRISRNAEEYCRKHGQTWIKIDFDDKTT